MDESCFDSGSGLPSTFVLLYPSDQDVDVDVDVGAGVGVGVPST